MAKKVEDIVLDQALNYIKNNGTRIDLNSAEPADYTAATSTLTLGNDATLTSGSYTGPVAGDTNGRKLTINAVTGISTSAGTCTHVAISDVTGTALLLATTTGGESLAGGGTADVAAFDYEIADPT